MIIVFLCPDDTQREVQQLINEPQAGGRMFVRVVYLTTPGVSVSWTGGDAPVQRLSYQLNSVSPLDSTGTVLTHNKL